MESVACKKCQKCKEDKPLGAYRKDRRRKDGLKYVCKTCTDLYQKEYKERNPELVRKTRNASYLLCKYGLTIEQYNAMLLAQNNKCAICNSESTDNSQHKTMLVDHNHTTGKVRALICHPCNATIGYSKEDTERLIKCAEYLKVHNG